MIFYVSKYHVLNTKRDKNNTGLKDISTKINVNNNIDLVKQYSINRSCDIRYEWILSVA